MIDKKTTINEIEQRLKDLKAEKEKLLHEAAAIDGEYLSSYEIRPSGRHILTIGEDLIQDQFAALVELVKNCYDADSPDAIICFKRIPEENRFEIRIEDHGHGMSTDDVINKWLVPSTTNKLQKQKSPKGRILQGRKGIGRYAASILGDDLQLETVDTSGVKTTIYIKWDEFLNFEYLDQIDIPIQAKQTKLGHGTVLTIHSSIENEDFWNKDNLNQLRFELKKLIPPKIDFLLEDDFQIWLNFENFFIDKDKNILEEITPYPVLELFDYKISGTISSTGKVELLYENQKVRNGAVEHISYERGHTYCGNLKIDVRVYDREGDAIDMLINRGLKDEYTGTYVSRLQARQLLNRINGIGVYRNGFRIRPLGDADFDWLKLNEQRIQNPSMKIGSNQVAGYIHVESEEISGLEEKSARDGLKNNEAYKHLVNITRDMINLLEQRRYIFRRKLGLSNSSHRLERQLESLYDYSPLKRSIASSLKKANMSESIINEIEAIISREENKKNEAIEEIRKAVAVYQGQATLGKIINIILHEGRRPLNYFKNQIPNLNYYGSIFSKKRDQDSAQEIIRLTSRIEENASVFVKLFGRLDPLSAKRRETKTEIILAEVLHGTASIFEAELKNHNINIEIICPTDLKFFGWSQDIYTIFTNLIDNSVYWIIEKECEEREICISVSDPSGGGLCIDYIDSGPGINNDLLESGVIFEPQFTTKPNGTGLGLSIAGEAAIRNGFTLTALQNEKGAHFRLSVEKEERNV